MKIGELLSRGRHQLANPDLGRLESELLLAHLLGVTRAWLYANPDSAVGAKPEAEYLQQIERRKNGEPVAYLTGTCEFWSLELEITPDVLIPRPESELLVETALEIIPAEAEWRVADLGTGSGAIALAIASERPNCEMHATDISQLAIDVARKNEANLLPGRIQFHAGSWLAPLDGKFDLIISNPPYVAAQDPHLIRGDCRFEPRTALTPGSDGLAAIRHIAGASPDYLESGAVLIVEHGYDQGEDVRRILEERSYANVVTRQDLSGHDRVTSGQLAGRA
jgi:release factor glutamine methyltransferase